MSGNISSRSRTEYDDDIDIDDNDDVAVDPNMPWGIYVPPSYSSTNGGGGHVRIANANGKSFPCGHSFRVGRDATTGGTAVVVDDDDVHETSADAGGEAGDECKTNRSGRGRRRSSLKSAAAATSSEDVPPGTTRDDDIDDDDHHHRASRGEGDEMEEESMAMAVAGERHHRASGRTVTEERLHPEEALFLHLRGLLRITAASLSSSDSSSCDERKCGTHDPTMTTMTTRDLFTRMLPETNVSIAAYLAYAHLRSQGYILVRYTERRMGLLRELMRTNDTGIERRTKERRPSTTLGGGEEESMRVDDDDAILPPTTDVGGRTTTRDEESIATSKGRTAVEGRYKCHAGTSTLLTNASSEGRYASRYLRWMLSDDVATAPPPCVVVSSTRGGRSGCTTEGRAVVSGDVRPRLAYYAYKPNSRFKRTNPGLPDFGVAVMPYNDNQPTFETLFALVSMCEGGGRNGADNDDDIVDDDDAGGGGGGGGGIGIPLRVVTVADGGAVIAFGVTNGEVPSIKRSE